MMKRQLLAHHSSCTLHIGYPWRYRIHLDNRSIFNARQQHTSSTAPNPRKPYYVTTPIFYVNAGERQSKTNTEASLNTKQLHMSDIFTPWCWRTYWSDGKFCKGKKLYYARGRMSMAWKLVAGLRSHGILPTDGPFKIQQAAAKAGQDVRSFCNQNFKSFDVGL